MYKYLPPGTSPADRGKFDQVALTHSPVLSIAEGEAPGAEHGAPARRPSAGEEGPSTRLYPKRGGVINEAAARRPAERDLGGGDFTLNFSDADIREVVQAILGDTLGENFIIDAAVQGTITVQTSRPLKRVEVMPTLEALLAMQGVAMVRTDGMYRVLPMAKAVRGNLVPRLPDTRGPGRGFNVRIVPLQYIAAGEMQKIIEPFLPEGGVVRVDESRNMLLLAGTPEELGRLQETIDIFDVNWLEGMTVGMFRLHNVEMQEMIDELDAIIGEKSHGPMAGMFRLVPVERLNSILVITPQPDYLNEARLWIERLDRTSEARADERRLHVYQVQNSTADHLAELLGQLFSDREQGGGRGGPPAPALAPGLEPARIATDTSPGEEGQMPAGGERPAPAVSAGPGGAVSGQLEYPLQVVADTVNNTIIIHSTRRDYEKIERLLGQLDVMPRQVLVEATIAEITLGGQLEYGVQWYFDHKIDGDHSGNGALGNVLEKSVGDVLTSNGFTYAITNAADQVRLLLNALAEESKVRILSSPHLLVVDGQAASINVGDQVPISTGSTTTDGGSTVERFELKDTGVLLEVTPRINAGGMVLMEIRQEVTDPGEIDSATGQRTFLQRVVESVVAMQTSQTVVLGGLIRENKTSAESGIPVLYKAPVVGKLFGNTRDELRRTELIVLITPLIVRNQTEAVQVTEEIKGKLKGLWAPRSPEERPAPEPAAVEPLP